MLSRAVLPILIVSIFSVTGLTADPPSNPTVHRYDDYRLTHELVPCGPVPTALDPNGVYPYMSYCETSNRPVLKRYDFIVLENDRLRVTVCPTLGGKITSLVHKASRQGGAVCARRDPLHAHLAALLLRGRRHRSQLPDLALADTERSRALSNGLGERARLRHMR